MAKMKITYIALLSNLIIASTAMADYYSDQQASQAAEAANAYKDRSNMEQAQAIQQQQMADQQRAMDQQQQQIDSQNARMRGYGY